MKHAKVGCSISAAASCPLPAQRVIGKVGVNESVPKPFRTLLPGQEKVFDEKRADHHAYAVGQPARRPQLAHAGIYQRIPRVATLPGAQPWRVLAPGESSIGRAPGRLWDVRVMIQHVVRELPPTQLSQVDLSAARPASRAVQPGALLHQVPEAAWADLAKVQMR